MYIISGSKLGYHQRRNLTIVVVVSLIITIGLIVNTDNFFFLKILFSIIFLLSVLMMFLKKGIIIENNKIKIGTFLFGKTLSKSSNQILDLTKITILKFKSKLYAYDNTSYNYFKRWEPDLSYENFIYEIHLLNDNHTKKSKLIYFEKEELAQQVVDFITKNSSLIYEKYNPDFN